MMIKDAVCHVGQYMLVTRTQDPDRDFVPLHGHSLNHQNVGQPHSQVLALFHRPGMPRRVSVGEGRPNPATGGREPQISSALPLRNSARLVPPSELRPFALGGRGIRVNAVAPGVGLDMPNIVRRGAGREFTSGMQALRRLTQPDDIGGVNRACRPMEAFGSLRPSAVGAPHSGV